MRLIADCGWGYCRIFLFELKFVMGFRNTGFTVFPTVRIQPPLIRFRYYVRANWESAVSRKILSRKTVNTKISGMFIVLWMRVKFLRIKQFAALTTATSLFFSTLLSQYGREMFPSANSWRSVRRAGKYGYSWLHSAAYGNFSKHSLLVKVLFFDHKPTPVTWFHRFKNQTTEQS